MVVADRGLLSLDNIEALSKLQVAGGRVLEFILAVPGRRYGEFVDLLQPMNARAAQAREEFVHETQWQGYRLVVAHQPQQAAEQSRDRRARIHALEQRAAQLAGKLMLITNVGDMTAAEVVLRYKSLADIERGFRVLKSEIEIAPVCHRLPERIKAHASICFMALILYRVMRQRLQRAGSELSPESALADLRRIQWHTVSIDNAAPIQGVSTIHPRQADVLAALNIKKPTQDAQMTLL